MRYTLGVNLNPEICPNGGLAYYWHIDLITEDGIFTVGSGWSEYIDEALEDALGWEEENLPQ
jgi:hypothetical protein